MFVVMLCHSCSSQIFTINAKYVWNNKFAMLHNDSGLLICGLLKEEFRENFGAILDFLGIPNESKS